MNHHSAQDIKALFEASASHDHSDSAYLQMISRALGACRAAGLDVTLDFFGVCAEEAFSLKLDAKSWRMSTSGILHIGHSQHLVAFATSVQRKNDESMKPCAILLVSTLDIRYQGPNTSLRTLELDMVNDSKSMKRLQEFVVQVQSTQHRIARADVAGAFANSQQARAALSRPPRLPAPQKAVAAAVKKP